MMAFKFSLPPKGLRRLAAAFVCLALLYFAAGGSFLHEHTRGQDTVCHVCQSLHAPALAAAGLAPAPTPEIAGWHEVRPIAWHTLNEVSLHHAGRAPPSNS